jgi:Na+-translocating ferredoxin:NAD+ oxidoreductase RnfD subunit
MDRGSTARWFEAIARYAPRIKLSTPKAYLGWAFAAIIPIALTQPPTGNELRVLALAVLGSVAVDIVLALALAFTLERAAGRGPRPPRGVFARRRPAEPFWPSGALLAGVIVGLLLDPNSAPAVTLAAGALGSISKHVVRYDARHVFNPAAFGLLAASLLFREQISWWGALPAVPLPAILLMIAAGAIVLDRCRKLPAAIAFFATYYGIFLLIALVDPHKAAEAFRSPISNAILFLALFMLSDPPTAPISGPTQLLYGTLTAVIAATIELTAHTQTFPITALLAGNLYAATVRNRRRVRAARQPRYT